MTTSKDDPAALAVFSILKTLEALSPEDRDRVLESVRLFFGVIGQRDQRG